MSLLELLAEILWSENSLESSSSTYLASLHYVLLTLWCCVRGRRFSAVNKLSACEGRDAGLVVSILAFNSDDRRLNPADY